MRPDAVILAEDVRNIYEVPLAYHEQGLDEQVCAHFGLDSKKPDLNCWRDIAHNFAHPEGEVTIAIVGKYTSLQDSYKSLGEALSHGGIANKVKVNIEWLDSEIFEQEDNQTYLHYLENVSGILVPGGFGKRGSEGKIEAIRLLVSRTFLISVFVSVCKWLFLKLPEVWQEYRKPARLSLALAMNRLLV